MPDRRHRVERGAVPREPAPRQTTELIVWSPFSFSHQAHAPGQSKDRLAGEHNSIPHDSGGVKPRPGAG